MTDIDKKREEIQLEIEDTLKVCGANPLTASALAYDLLLELSLKDVAIKVDGKVRGGFVNDVWDAVHIEELDDCKVSLKEALDKAGYVAVEPLIKEK